MNDLTIPGQLYCPSVDVCALCGDCYCDGVACFADLDPENPDDQPRIEQVHAWIRAGRLLEQMSAFLAMQENRA